MRGIIDYTQSLAELRVEFNKTNCLNNYRVSSCRRCLSICPKKALNLDDKNQLSFNSKKCNSCGLCLSICPTECFSTNPSFTQTLLLKLNKDLPFTLSCQKSKQAGSIKLKCLASLHEATLFQAAISSQGITLMTDTCQKCSLSQTALPLLVKKVRVANILLSEIEMPRKIRISEKTTVADKKIGRQDFFRVAAKEALKLSLSNLPSLSEEQVLPNRSLLLKHLAFNKPKKSNQLLPFYEISVRNECDLCLKCLAFCPTKALIAKDSNDTISLILKNQLCVGCNLCLKGCPKNCIAIQRLTDLSKLLSETILKEEKLVPCQICGKLTSQSSKKCDRCQKEESLNKSLSSLFE